VRDRAIVDDPGHAFDQRHAIDREGRQIQRARELQILIRQNRKRQMQALDRLPLIVCRLGRKAIELRHAKTLEISKMIAESA